MSEKINDGEPANTAELLAALKQIVEVSRREPAACVFGTRIIKGRKAIAYADAWDRALWDADVAIAKAESREPKPKRFGRFIRIREGARDAAAISKAEGTRP